MHCLFEFCKNWNLLYKIERNIIRKISTGDFFYKGTKITHIRKFEILIMLHWNRFHSAVFISDWWGFWNLNRKKSESLMKVRKIRPYFSTNFHQIHNLSKRFLSRGLNHHYEWWYWNQHKIGYFWWFSALKKRELRGFTVNYEDLKPSKKPWIANPWITNPWITRTPCTCYVV